MAASLARAASVTPRWAVICLTTSSLRFSTRSAGSSGDRREVVEDVLDEAGPQVALGVVPGVELDLHDPLVPGDVALQLARLAGVGGELADARAEPAHEERLARAPVAEQSDRQRRRDGARREQRREGVDVVVDLLAYGEPARLVDVVGAVGGEPRAARRPSVAASWVTVPVSVPTASCSPSGDQASDTTAPAALAAATSAPVSAADTRTVSAVVARRQELAVRAEGQAP